MNNKEYIGLLNISQKLKGVNVNINNEFLKLMLVKASNSNRPHCNLNFIKKIKLRPTTKYSCDTVYGWVKYRKTVPLEKVAMIVKLSKINQNEVEENIVSINAGRGKIKPKFPIIINMQLGLIIGHILGDGSIDKKYKQVFFSNSEKELLKEFSDNMSEIFKVKPRIWMQKTPKFGNTKWDKRINNIDELIAGRNCGLFYPTICGLILNAIFNDFAIGKDKKITNSIINTNKEFRMGIIRAFYDDEGSVGKKNIRLFQDNKEMLGEFKELLKEFGISSSGIKKYVKRDKDRFYFDIFRKSNFLKFQNEIGFTSPKKSERLKKLVIIKNYGNAK